MDIDRFYDDAMRLKRKRVNVLIPTSSTAITIGSVSIQQIIMSMLRKTPLRCRLALNLFLFFATVALSINAQASTKVAFIGDQGMGSGSLAVLSLVADEGADLLMIQGDLAYADNSAMKWDASISKALGHNFPVLTVVGNHENFEWPLYQRLIQQRIDRASGLSCTGETGVKANCRFGDLQVVQVAPAIYEVGSVNAEDDYPGFLESSFEGSDAPWRICAWHKTMGAMQTSYKGDSTGWGVFDACLDAGAMIAMAHAHTYSRTYLLSDYRTQTVAHRNSVMTLEPGRSFAFVSGLGGKDIREQGSGGDWFASIYTSAQGATYGALFCDFEETTADCYFKAIDGSVPDEFRLRSDGGLSSDSGSARISPLSKGDSLEPGVFSRTDKKEFWWIDQTANGQWGNTWISEACARSMGEVTYEGRWSQLVALAPAFDSVANPCLFNGGNSPPPPQTTDPESSEGGYVFVRTDKVEYRWIERNSSGGLDNIWIDKACADRLDGPRVQGDWGDLLALAPGVDLADSPCSSNSGNSIDPSQGVVFSRTDKTEYRWIEPDASGSLGSIWIDKACAERMGGPSVYGDWFQLMDFAPGFDTVANPCF